MQMIRKTAAGKAADALSYVLSDATVDRYGDVIEPAGWQLEQFRSNPIALFNHNPNFPVGKWKNIRVEDERLIGELEPAKPGTSHRIDELLRLIDQDILRATSVGFRAIDTEPLDPKRPGAGTRFTKQELLETSIVSVPANPAALSLAKSLGISDDTMRLAFGEHAGMRRALVKSGGHAVTKPRIGGIPMNVGAQIQDTQTRLNAARDQLTEMARGEDYDEEQASALQDEIDATQRRLSSLERTERSLAARTAEQTPQTPQLPARRPLTVPAKEIKPGDYVGRAAAATLHSYIQRRAVEDIVRERWGDDEATMIVTRAAQPTALTTQTGWAAELVVLSQADFLATLEPSSVFNPLSAAGTSLSFGPGAGAIKIPSLAATPSITGSFVGEAQPIPVRRAGLTSITLTPHKMGVITRFSREIAMYSTPAIEGICRDAIRIHTSITVDSLLLDNVAASAVRPAGLTNGVAAITAATGGGYAAVLKDIKALTAPFYALNAGRKLVMIVNPAQRLDLSMVPGPAGVPFGWTTEFTSQFQMIVSTTVPVGNVYMIDAADFVSVNGGLEFDVSEEATLHIEDTAPLNISAPGAPATVAAPVESMFQTAQIALRMLVNINWAMRRSGMVQWITGVNWGP
jgi:HK97 family phage prohead protease/HK97 family phage major capsid protein